MLRTPRSSQYSGGVFSSVPVFPMQGDMKKIAFYPHWLLSLLWMTFLLETFKSWNSQLNLGRQRRGDALKRHGWASLGGRGCHGNEITLPWTHWEPPEVLERESDQTRCGETTKAPESDGGWGRLGGAERPADSLGRQWPADGAAWVWALPCTHRGIRL